MNNLSVLRGSYIQNCIIDFMVQIPTMKKENSSIEKNISWRDIQGLGWMFTDDFEVEMNLKVADACA